MNDVVLKLDGVGKKYKFFELDDIHIELPQGRIMGFIGPNGAGKSWAPPRCPWVGARERILD